MMKNIKILKQVLKRRKLEKLLISIQIVIVIYFFITQLWSLNLPQNQRRSFEENLKYDTKNIIHLQFPLDILTAQDYLQFREEALKNKNIQTIGFYSTNESLEIIDDFRINKKIKLDEYIKNKDPLAIVNNDLVNAIKYEKEMDTGITLKVKNGRSLIEKDFQVSDSDIIPILIGSLLEEFEVYSVGDVFTVRDKTYQVVGVLDESNIWNKYSLMSNCSYMNLNDKIVIPYSDYFYKDQIKGTMPVNYYCFVKNDTNNVKEYLKNIAFKLGLDVEVSIVSDEINEQYDAMKAEDTIWVIFSVVLIIIVSIGIIFTVFISLISRKHEIGVRLALGASKRDILNMLISEFLIVILGSGVIAAIGTIILYSQMRVGYDNVFNPFEVTPVMILSILLSLLVMCIIPIGALVIHLKKINPREFIGGDK